MLFNSFEFIFLFLPCVVCIYTLCLRHNKMELGLSFLVLASLFFYGYWQPAYLYLILFSIALNYFIGRKLCILGKENGKWLLTVGITINLALLGYFKYANFFVENLDSLLDLGWNIEKIFLPLAISFFTFQQISYLVDVWEGKAEEYSFLHYSLFVCFFPQLIAGPIVHHREMLPQFMRKETFPNLWKNIAIGLSIFCVGLFKKTIIADGLSPYVSPVYDNTIVPGQLDFFTAWGSTLAYTFQLYFDFSGYSDMAIGCARMFGIVLPLNFFSPYKAVSIIDFWRRWHITLSRFLRDYLYIALGGNRKGKSRRYINLFLTMLLGGLWHGAGWPFVIWGGLHGMYLAINHLWRKIIASLSLNISENKLYILACWLITFLAVVVSWVFFRSPNLDQAGKILYAMAGFNGASLPSGIVARIGGLEEILASLGVGVNDLSGSHFLGNVLCIVMAAFLAFFMPNVAQVFNRYSPVLYESDKSFKGERESSSVEWSFSLRWVFASSSFFLLGVLTLMQVSEFLYFQF